MFWNKKNEEKGLPELPPMKPIVRSAEEERPAPQEIEFPEFRNEPVEAEEKEIPELPEEELPEIPEQKVPGRLVSSKIREITEIEMPKERYSAQLKPVSTSKTEDVYIKIDKFHSARKSLAAAKTKVHEIEQLLGKIRETKMREEQELASWEKEIELIKTKVDDVTKNIFEKVE